MVQGAACSALTAESGFQLGAKEGVESKSNEQKVGRTGNTI